MKLFDIKIRVRDGENEYDLSNLVSAPDQAHADSLGNEMVKTYFGEETRLYEGETYENREGTRMVWIKSVRDVAYLGAPDERGKNRTFIVVPCAAPLTSTFYAAVENLMEEGAPGDFVRAALSDMQIRIEQAQQVLDDVERVIGAVSKARERASYAGLTKGVHSPGEFMFWFEDEIEVLESLPDDDPQREDARFEIAALRLAVTALRALGFEKVQIER